MSSDVRSITTLCNCSIGVRCAIGIDCLGAVVFLVGLAVVASQIGANLGTDTDSVADLDGSHVLADLDGAANNLVTDTKGKRNLSPTSRNAVEI